jgi:acyl-CoA reductase-like NAD-dependent aldehyde dehydrogenase
MGNAVVVKPSEYTPLSVLALAKVLNRELPEGSATGWGVGEVGREERRQPRLKPVAM